MLEGIYESLITRDLAQQLTALTDVDQLIVEVDAADQPHVLARHVAEAVLSTLEATRDQAERVAIVNSLLDTRSSPIPRV